jgi:excisionase family DNA binding protein
MKGTNTDKATCTVEEAAALLGTTTRGIYALHERGRLPPTVGPGRRLLWRRDDLLQCRRRASSPEKDRR